MIIHLWLFNNFYIMIHTKFNEIDKTVEFSFKPGMQNIRPAEAFYPARKAHDFAYLARLFPKNIL